VVLHAERLARRATIPGVARAVLYGKPGCHLCEEARAAVERVRARRPFDLEEVDVTLDPALHRRYGERIPVLELDGEELFQYFVDEAALAERVDRVNPS
jgi:glutaredoxin